mgnify:CR=1 FL=1|tara:strand:- start:510 stop:944 length:435 start_codon:yes stop_codon:yes gene_type:complete
MKNEKYESFDDRHLGIKTKQNQKSLSYQEICNDRINRKEKEQEKEIDVGDVQYIFSIEPHDMCSHSAYDYDSFTTKVYATIESDKNSEIVLRRYLDNQTGTSRYQIVKYFLCNKCNQFRIRKGMSAIDLTHKEFKELIDGYIKS